MFCGQRLEYTRNGQKAEGPYLCLMLPDTGDFSADLKAPLRGMVRNVRMSQCGHFMMGDISIGGKKISVSGSYGNNGLPITVPLEIYEQGDEISSELRDAWNTGGGWNGCGTEAQAMLAWAQAHFPRKCKRPVILIGAAQAAL